MRSAAAALALGLTLTAAGLSSCATPDDPVQPPEPDPSVTPVYASEEEALAAAEELYGRYLEISDAVGQAGWKDPNKFAEVDKDRALEQDEKTASDLHGKGWTQVGSSSFDSTTLQQITDHGVGAVDLIVYLCVDVHAVDVIDTSGASVVSSNRKDRQPLEVEMDDFDGPLKVNRSQAWSGRNFC